MDVMCGGAGGGLVRIRSAGAAGGRRQHPRAVHRRGALGHPQQLPRRRLARFVQISQYVARTL